MRSHINHCNFCMWWSSGPAASRWIQKEVVLPLPSEPEPDEYTSQPNYSFCADIVFTVGANCLCWVDLLLQGMLICDHVTDHRSKFRFVALPWEGSVNISLTLKEAGGYQINTV